MSNALAKLAGALAGRRAPDGGYPAVPDGSPDSESTALAALAQYALAAEAAHEAIGWLEARQRSDGAWPFTDVVPQASWASAWAALALARSGAGAEPLGRAAGWLVERTGRRPSLVARALGSLTQQDRRLEQDLTLRGWPWHEAAASWVEPTASALLALRVLSERAPVSGARERIQEGERLLWDRVCVNGGWNYGNRRVLGEALQPFPDTTAFALLALQGSARRAELGRSFRALDALLDERASSLALALGALALELHGRDAARMRARLTERIKRIGPPDETRSVAFALLALGGGAERLRVPS